jgi:hypothetical protein
MNRFFEVIFVLLIFTLSGCVSTQGTQVKELEEKGSYEFQYSGEKEEVVQKMKRILVPEGWTIRNEDISAGVISAQKTLREDEKISQTAFGAAMSEAVAGMSTENQDGRLSFLLSSENGGTFIEMTPELVVTTEEDDGLTSSKSENTSTPQQGHPMVVKYGLAIHRTEGFRLIDPNPDLLIEAESNQSE